MTRDEYDAEIAEFNAGFDAYEAGVPVDHEPSDTQYDVWRTGWAWAAFEPMHERIAELEAIQNALDGHVATLNRRIAELEGSANLFNECYKRARAIWRKQHPERAGNFDPDGAEAIAAMIADHDIWEKHSLTRLVGRITELESACDAALPYIDLILANAEELSTAIVLGATSIGQKIEAAIATYEEER
jgi:hypothetical protein